MTAQPGRTVTVAVHGFAVDDASATTGTYPTLFKHLYWSGLPVLFDETQLRQAQATQVVGVLWPGNLGPFGVSYFPGDEFNAFQTGVPLGAFLEDRKALGQSLNIVAHSLGNLAVNSAITRAPNGPCQRF